MSTADRPAAMPTQTTTTLNHERGAALGAARGRSDDGAARARDQYLALAAAVPIHGDSLATELVRELVRSFHLDGGGVAAQVDGLADRGVNVALKGGLHADVGRDVDLVRGGEGALDVVGDVATAADTAVLDHRGEQRVGCEAALGGDPAKPRVDLGELGAVQHVAAVGERVERLDAARAAGDDADRPGRGDRGGRRV